MRKKKVVVLLVRQLQHGFCPSPCLVSAMHFSIHACTRPLKVNSGGIQNDKAMQQG